MAAHLISIRCAVDGAHAVRSSRPGRKRHLTAKLAIPEDITVRCAAATIARVEPGGECLAIHARATGWRTGLHLATKPSSRLSLPSLDATLIDQPWKASCPARRGAKWARPFCPMTLAKVPRARLGPDSWLVEPSWCNIMPGRAHRARPLAPVRTTPGDRRAGRPWACKLRHAPPCRRACA